MKNSFLKSYIETALWSSTEYAFGTCPCCHKEALLCRYPEAGNGDAPLWCAECGEGEPNPAPMDDNYSVNDLAPETLAKMTADCAAFQAENAEMLAACGLTDERAGHNFWLNRNGHGAGFWDEDKTGDEMAACDALSLASKAADTCDLYAGDDGKLYLS